MVQRGSGRGPAVLGRAAILDGESYAIVGVMPPELSFPKAVQLWVPLVITPAMLDRRGAPDPLAVGKLRPGVNVARAPPEPSRITQAAQAQPPRQDPRHGAPGFPLPRQGGPAGRPPGR